MCNLTGGDIIVYSCHFDLWRLKSPLTQLLAIPVGSEVKVYERVSLKCLFSLSDDHHKGVTQLHVYMYMYMYICVHCMYKCVYIFLPVDEHVGLYYTYMYICMMIKWTILHYIYIVYRQFDHNTDIYSTILVYTVLVCTATCTVHTGFIASKGTLLYMYMYN